MWSVLINAFTLAVAIVVVYILWVLPATNRNNNKYLNILLTALMLHLLTEQLWLVGIIDITMFSIVAVSVVISYGPTLYFYGRSFYQQKSDHFVLHFVIPQLGVGVIWFADLNFALIPQWLLSSYYTSILMAYFIITSRLMCTHTIKKHQAWMKTIGLGFGVLVLLHVAEVLWINLDINNALHAANVCTSVQNGSMLFFLLIVIKQIVTRPQAFSKVNVRIPSRFSPSQVNETALTMLVSFVENDKAFKNPDLKSGTISDATGLSTHQISELVNGSFKKNFNEWINDFRIEEAKQLLRSSSLSIKEIYFEVGFNSKSAFNEAFKKRLTVTPSAYRSQNIR